MPQHFIKPGADWGKPRLWVYRSRFVWLVLHGLKRQCQPLLV